MRRGAVDGGGELPQAGLRNVPLAFRGAGWFPSLVAGFESVGGWILKTSVYLSQWPQIRIGLS